MICIILLQYKFKKKKIQSTAVLNTYIQHKASALKCIKTSLVDYALFHGDNVFLQVFNR